VTDVQLRHLRTFVAVAEELHFRAAASRLYLSPPAVTEHVKALEREMGVSLFTRGRPIALTPPGERLLGHARLTLEGVEQALRDVRACR
jgi:DNA-binding transcriptional LysR family regulator